ncbi:MAG: ribbon-helix-helix protein, CopG family [Thermoplasmata archaeon]|nr:ribbon-helix-helix protein, CopG family [Thermoplasmata archaeon]
MKRGSARSRRKPGVVRLGVSLEPELLAQLDGWVRRRNSPSRSDAVRALIRKELTTEALLDPEAPAVASVMLLYRHDEPGVLQRLTAVEHRWEGHVRFSGHVHLSAEACLEVVAISGSAREVLQMAEDLRGVKRIAFGGFTIGAPGILCKPAAQPAEAGAMGHSHDVT